ncbi:MAG: tRNA lysidine(34) synthetase TilS [Candidatus Wallbacteria bacterium]
MSRDNFEIKFLDFIKSEKLINCGDSIMIAYSGGADSSCLLFLLSKFSEKLKIKLSAFYLNHNIRSAEELSDEMKLIRDNCEKTGISLVIETADVKREAALKKESVEEAGRNIRYERLLKKAAETGANKIATAHHLDDCAEVMILKLLKGASPSAMSGIKPVFKNNIIRPLLFASKNEILEFCAKNGVNYSTDSTNSDNSYEHNFVRNRIIPAFKEFSPAFLDKIFTFQNIQKSENDFVNSAVYGFFKEYVTAGPGGLSLKFSKKDFMNIHSALKRRAVLHAAALLGADSSQIKFGLVKEIIEFIENDFKSDVFDIIKGSLVISKKAFYGTDYKVKNEILEVRSIRTAIADDNRHIYSGRDLESIQVNGGKMAVMTSGAYKFKTDVFEYDIEFGILDSIEKIDNIAGKISSAPDYYLIVIGNEKKPPFYIRTFEPGDYIKIYGMDGKGKKVSDIFIDLKIPRGLRSSIPLITDSKNNIIAVGDIRRSNFCSYIISGKNIPDIDRNRQNLAGLNYMLFHISNIQK